MLERVHTLEDGIDSRIWIPLTDESFSVSSFFSALSREHHGANWWVGLREAKIPSRVAVFSWLSLCGRILTMDSLR